MSDTYKGPQFAIVSIVMFTITWLLFLLRATWRLCSKQLGTDDAMLVGAMAVLSIHTCFGFAAISHGFGKSKTILSPQENRMALKYFFLLQITYKPLGAFVKLAFLFLYLRIFQIRKFQIFTYIMMANVILGATAFVVATVLQCTPVERAYNKAIPGKCINLMAFWYSHSVWHAAGDFIIFLMPVPVIRTLQMPGSKKLALTSVFSLGAFTCAASIIRMTTLVGSSKSNDPSYGSYDAVMWTEVEANTSVICACLPALRSPALKLLRRLQGKPDPTSYASGSHKLGSLKNSRQTASQQGQQQQQQQHHHHHHHHHHHDHQHQRDSSYTVQSLQGRNWTYRPGERHWYDTELGPSNASQDGFFHTSEERIVGIVKTTDVHVIHGKDDPRVTASEKHKLSTDTEVYELGRGDGSDRF